MHSIRRFNLMLAATVVMVGTVAVPAATATPTDSADLETTVARVGTGRLIALKSLGGGESFADKTNARGDLTGRSRDATGKMQAVVWWHGQRNPTRLRVNRATPNAISDHGIIAGQVDRKGGGLFLWNKGKSTYRWDPANADLQATGVNDRGEVVGTAYFENAGSKAFRWQRGRLTWLPVPKAARSQALGVNNRGQTIGVVIPRGSDYGQAVLWQRGRMTRLGTLGGAYSAPIAINERGQVAGNSAIKGSSSDHPFLWQRGRMTDLLSNTTATGGRVNALSDSGMMTGSATWADGYNRPVLWKRGRMIDIGFGTHHGIGSVVNDRGDVGGVSWAPSTESPGVPFRWHNGKTTLFPEPAADMWVGVVGIAPRGKVTVLQEDIQRGLRIFRSA
ncbi:hypothetical protein AB0F81_29525 [Actinoplanes sp. NPDC024001]|uniref:hypothetical protein n=1 Tax=Actinoplanes sp. NPDC024001 TaxID=3154598 RepID=UPI0033DCEE7C